MANVTVVSPPQITHREIDGPRARLRRAMISLAVVDNQHSEVGTEVTVVWGEEGRGSSKPTVERHVQASIRATVAAVPYAQVARNAYRPH